MRVEPLRPEICRQLRRRAIFECCKWDPQVEDVDTLAPFAVVLKRSAWEFLAKSAEALASETIKLEQALAGRPDLFRRLAIPRQIRKVLNRMPRTPRHCRDVRVMRFDFHPTEQGWKVSEANSDVPGGYNEASGWTDVVSEHVPSGMPTGDPVKAWVAAVSEKVPEGGVIALVHATAYTDDRQVMAYLARRLRQGGLRPVLLAPDHLRWRAGEARIETSWFSGRADFVFRFFPAEWLPNLGCATAWPSFFGDTATPLCNPATALLTQSKRWPLVSEELGLELRAWRELLPETRDPREVRGQPSEWVFKPALGRVGDLVGIAGVTEPREWKKIRRGVRWWPGHWVAQRRFSPLSVVSDGQPWHVCFGVFTVNARAVGIYGRAAPQPLINHLARELAVLVEATPSAEDARIPPQVSYEPLGTF